MKLEERVSMRKAGLQDCTHVFLETFNHNLPLSLHFYCTFLC